jgi:hypothetical protein
MENGDKIDKRIESQNPEIPKIPIQTTGRPFAFSKTKLIFAALK